jgi:hypothetical protein
MELSVAVSVEFVSSCPMDERSAMVARHLISGTYREDRASRMALLPVLVSEYVGCIYPRRDVGTP